MVDQNPWQYIIIHDILRFFLQVNWEYNPATYFQGGP